MRVITTLTLGLALSACSFMGLTGCSYLGRKTIEKPKVALDRVNVTNVGVQGATVLFGVKVDNPNPFALKLDGLRYDVEIGGKHLSKGELERPAEVAAKGQAVIDIPVPVRFSDVFASTFDFLQRGTSTFRVTGAAKFGFLEIPFEQKGDLKLKN